MNKVKRLLPVVLLTILAVSACEKPKQVKPTISVSAQSQAVFDNGISFSSSSPQQAAQPQTQSVTFTASEPWSAMVDDTKSSSWLTVEPESGGAGMVYMTVKAQPNNTDNPRKATVAIKSGTTVLSFTVEQAARQKVAVTSISLDKTALDLTAGETGTLSATVKPDEATDKTVIWSSSDADVATVDGNGKVTAVKEGTATISAKAGEQTASCTVTVKAPVVAVEGIRLNKTELVLTEDESETLIATVSPENATDKTVTWSSSDAGVATVDDSGKVTAVKEGTATISARAGEQTASCTVTVKAPVIDVEGIRLNKTELVLMEGESETLIATVSPENATDKTVSWSSDDSDIATVGADGTVVAVKKGSAYITAKAGDKRQTCLVIVKYKSPEVDNPEGLNNENVNW